MIRENGIYFGLFAGEVVMVRVNFFHDDLTIVEYDTRMTEHIYCQPMGKLPPLQTCRLRDVKQLERLRVFKKPENVEDFDNWLGWLFDWNEMYLLWYDLTSTSPFDYINEFNREIKRQLGERKC